MAIVHVPGDLRPYTGGLEEVAIEASRVIDLKRELARRFPGLGERLEPLAIAIDGQIYQQADYEALRPDSDIHFVPSIAGG
jgi:molybdopterin converting factor small subunit